MISTREPASKVSYIRSTPTAADFVLDPSLPPNRLRPPPDSMMGRQSLKPTEQTWLRLTEEGTYAVYA